MSYPQPLRWINGLLLPSIRFALPRNTILLADQKPWFYKRWCSGL